MHSASVLRGAAATRQSCPPSTSAPAAAQQAQQRSTRTQPCRSLGSSCGRPVTGPEILLNHPAHSTHNGQTAQGLNARRLHSVLRQSRQRFELAASALCAPAPAQAAAELTLESEFQLLLRQLRDMNSAPSTALPSTSTASSSVLTAPRPKAPVLAPPPIDFDFSAPEFAPRDYGSAAGKIMVCTGSKCQRKGAAGVMAAVTAVVGDSAGIEVVGCKCLGKCSLGAAIRVKAEGGPCVRGQLHTELQPSEVGALLDGHFVASS